MLIQPYLWFDGRCEEAIEFYKQALGAEVQMLMRFGEAPEQPPPGTMPPGTDNKVMHATVKIGDSIVMVSDGDCAGDTGFKGFSLSLSAANPAEAERLFAALAEGGETRMPLGKTFFAASFGMVVDRFGVLWMVIAN
jgi:PhnB protein